MRIRQRRRLGDDVVRRRLLIGRGRADEDELLRAAAKQGEVALDVVRMVGDPVDDDVELMSASAAAPGRDC